MVNTVYSIDLETTGLCRYTDKILVIGVYNPTEGYISFSSPEEFKQWDREDKQYVSHTGAFDFTFLHIRGVDLFDRWLSDVRSLSSIVYPIPTLHPGQKHVHSLQNLVTHYLGAGDYKLRRDRMSEYSQDDVRAYNHLDCQYTYELYIELLKRLKPADLKFATEWLQPATKLCAQLELTGILVDVPYLNKFKAEALKKHEEVYKRLLDETQDIRAVWVRKQIAEVQENYRQMTIKAIERLKDKSKADATKERYHKLEIKAISAIEDFNFRSSTQMKWLFKDHLNLPIYSKRQQRETTDEQMLKQLAEKNQIAAAMLEFREVDKLVTTSIPAISDNIKPDGRIHPSFNVGGTVTGRLSSSNPNIQQVPKGSIRGSFVARAGHRLVSMDFGQIEPRVIAHASGDDTLLEIFREGYDLYSLLGLKLFGPESGLGKEKIENKYRDCAKTLALACFYGVGPGKFAEQVFKDLGIKLSRDQAIFQIQEFLDQFPKIVGLKQRLESEMINGVHGGYTYNLLGRPITISNPEMIRNALNVYVQGSASDLLIYAVFKNLKPMLEAYGVDHEILLLIHDQVLLSVETSMVEILKPELERALTTMSACQLSLTVPLKTDIMVTDRWVK